MSLRKRVKEGLAWNFLRIYKEDYKYHSRRVIRMLHHPLTQALLS